MITTTGRSQLLKCLMLQALQEVDLCKFFPVDYGMPPVFAELPAGAEQCIGHQLSLKIRFFFSQFCWVSTENTQAHPAANVHAYCVRDDRVVRCQYPANRQAITLVCIRH